jgi:hypothetical protein
MATAREKPRSYRLPPDGKWANAWKVALALGGVGLALSLFGWVTDAHRFAFSWLFAFLVCLTIALGNLFFVIVQHLTGSNWGVVVRRTSEIFMSGIPVLVLLFIPVILNASTLYPWMEHGEEAHAVLLEGTAEAQPEPEHHDPRHPPPVAEGEHDGHSPYEAASHHEIMEHKRKWLNPPMWLSRAALYFVVWLLLSMLYFRWSTRQDETKDPTLTIKMRKWSAPSIIAFAFALTFAAFDWTMSLEPTWYSTIYGVIVFAGSVIATLALVILVTQSLRNNGHLGEAVHTEHFHDLGKLLFGFTCFWAYVSFSQFMLQWYAAIPEELTYYHARSDEPAWMTVSVFLMIGHFVFPFFFLMSRIPKRRPGTLVFGCLWMLFMHVVDMYWFVMPYATGGRLGVHWMDLACLLAAGGLYFAYVFFRMRQVPLIPIGDPRLPRSMAFVQSH